MTKFSCHLLETLLGMMRGAGDSLNWKYVWFNRICVCFKDSRISKIYQDSTIVFSVFYLKRQLPLIVLGPPFQPWPSGLLLEDTNPILPKLHFMFSGRYWYHIQDFQDLFRRIFMICRCPSFPFFAKLRISNILKFIKIVLVRNERISWFFEVSWGLSR